MDKTTKFIKALVIPCEDSDCGHEIICDENGKNCYCPICIYCKIGKLVKKELSETAGGLLKAGWKDYQKNRKVFK